MIRNRRRNKWRLIGGILGCCVVAAALTGDGLSARWMERYAGENQGAVARQEKGQGQGRSQGQSQSQEESQGERLERNREAGAREATAGYRLEDDYYEYCNHERLAGKPIPAASDSWSYFYELGEEAYSQLDAILKSNVLSGAGASVGEPKAPQTEGQKINALYGTALDMESRNRAGLGELTRYVNRIRQASTIQEYVEALAWVSGETGLGSLFTISGEVDMSDSAHYAWYVSGPDLVLGKETLEDKSQEKLWEKYRRYMAQMLAYSGMEAEEATALSFEVYLFQKDLATRSLPLADSSDPSKIWNPCTLKQLSGMLSHVYLKPVLEGFGADGQSAYVVMEPETLKRVNSYLTRDHLPMLKAYSTVCLLHDMAPYLTEEIRDARLGFDRYRKGIQTVKTDEKLAGELTQGLLPFTFGKLYAENHFSEQDRAAVEKMARDILKTYEKRINRLDWMSRATKREAVKKLKSMRLKIGYPDEWPQEAADVKLRTPQEGGVLVGNVLAVMQSERARRQRLWSGPVDRTAWEMSPQTVNAYYSPLSNEIVFPAAILKPPFYDRNASYEENLGGIGMVIAHEVSHAFDDHGSQYDENGTYKEWWSEADHENFRQRTKAVAEYYDTFEGFDGRMVDGEQTLGENIADLGAISCVADLAGEDEETLRKLFERYAQIWASKYTAQSMILRLNTDVHAPARVRVNAVLGATDAFYQAYPEIQEGDGMYVEPQKRVNVW